MVTCFSCIAFVSCFFIIYGQETSSAIPSKLPTNLFYLKNTWDGKRLANSTDLNPVEFSIQPSVDSKNIIVSFNSTSITNDDQVLNPDVFGIMFMNKENSILQVEVTKNNKAKLNLFSGFDKQLEPNETLGVNYNEIVTKSNWIANISIPLDYFPRATDKIAAYANYSQNSENLTFIITLLSSKEETLLNSGYFLEYNLKNFTIFESDLWQRLLNVSPGGNAVLPTTTDESQTDAIKQDSKDPKDSNNEGSIIEQGLVTWIMFSAIFCGMLHIFVLSL